MQIFAQGDAADAAYAIIGGEGRVRLLRIAAPVFLAALGERAMLGTDLYRVLAARLRRTFTLFEDATFESVEVRLARQILYLVRRGERRTEHGIRPAGRFRQNDLGDLLGTTTRSIITIFNTWRASGSVIYDVNSAHLTLVREDGLQTLIESSAAG